MYASLDLSSNSNPDVLPPTKKEKILSLIYKILFFLIVVLGIALRLLIFDKVGGDYVTYKDAMSSLHLGINPYIYTLESFKTTGIEHGYAYLPTLLYIQYGIWILDNSIGVIISTVILWKIPVLICDLLILFFIAKEFNKHKINVSECILRLICLATWFINPYLMSRYEYSMYDPIFLLFILLALKNLDNDTFISPLFYSLAVSLKTIPVIVFPLFFLKTTKKLKFIFIGLLVFILISIPFMRSYYDFSTYINGSLFVHSQRALQGKPFLTYISYYLSPLRINFFQIKYIKEYAMLSMLLSFIIPVFLYYKGKLKDKYTWTLLSFFIYLLLTPVLSRTHILWIIPWLVIVVYRKFSGSKRVWVGIGSLLIFWIFSFMYLYGWNKGFESFSDSKGKPVLQETQQEWELRRLIRNEYYEIRNLL